MIKPQYIIFCDAESIGLPLCTNILDTYRFTIREALRKAKTRRWTQIRFNNKMYNLCPICAGQYRRNKREQKRNANKELS